MSKAQQKKRNQEKQARMEIVSKLYKRGYSCRQIREEVMKRLALDSYSLGTVQKDIKTLLEEWRENRIEDMDAALQLELERIDDTCRELWAQWEKSKEDYNKTTNTSKGAPSRNKETGEENIKTYSVERRTATVVGLGTHSISPKSVSSLWNVASSSACTLLKRKTFRATCPLRRCSLKVE